MILVTVGMHTDGFERLVKGMDCIAQQLAAAPVVPVPGSGEAGQGVGISEDVVIQIGATPYRPVTARWFTFASQGEMESLFERARVIVSHAGAGSILSVLRYRKPLIVMPRLKQYGEHVDDHQLELAEALSRAGMLLVANEVDDLWPQLQAAASFVPRSPDSSGLVSGVRSALLKLAPPPRRTR